MAEARSFPLWLTDASPGRHPPAAWTGHPCGPALTGSIFSEPARSALESAIAELPQDGALVGTVDYEGLFELLPCSGWRTIPATSWPDPAPAQQTGVWHHSLDQDTFIQGIHRIHEHIRAGDIYQVNLTRLASVEVAVEPRRLFARLQRTCPAPCTSYLELPSRTILSASPELFLRSVPGPEGLGITTQPIKGSSPRHPDPVRDQAIRRALEQNAKERAELIMITDLERNDLGQVCQFGSVHVEELCAPRTFSHVHHLVSTVTGTARPEETPLSVLTALFPGGSITGAPKKRAREIIAELEPGPRGLYTGAIGFFAHNQISQWSIAIRTLEHVGHRIRYGVGSGITIGSDPEQEWTETQIKEAGLLETLFDLRHDAGER